MENSVVAFTKYQGTGNDFILVDNRKKNFSANSEEIKAMCYRRFGIGADGLILLETSESADFRMVYFNSDGAESTFCGNGGRCISHFAVQLGIVTENRDFTFMAKDGRHTARVEGSKVFLQMKDVDFIQFTGDGFFLDTGSPHFVQWVEDIEKFPVFEKGRIIRNSPPYLKNGVNVNFVEKQRGEIYVRTYERGVENETLSCGTGVTAAALVSSIFGYTSPIKVQTPGGSLEVKFQSDVLHFQHIWLVGPAEPVFCGNWNTNSAKMK